MALDPLQLAPTVLDSGACGARPASSEFPDEARHSFCSDVRTARGARAGGLEWRSLSPTL